MSQLRERLKLGAHLIATAVVLPELCSYWVRAQLIGRDRALEGSSQLLALVPGIPGQYLRRAFLARVLKRCHVSATIEFGTLFSQADAQIDENAYIGPGCNVGWVHIEHDVLIAAGVHLPSGPKTHGTARADVPIRDQEGTRTCVRVGAGAWIGSCAVIMADVGRDTVIGAGAVVTSPIPDRAIAGGVPARVIRER